MLIKSVITLMIVDTRNYRNKTHPNLMSQGIASDSNVNQTFIKQLEHVFTCMLRPWLESQLPIV